MATADEGRRFGRRIISAMPPIRSATAASALELRDRTARQLGWALMRTHWGAGMPMQPAIRDWAYECRPIDLLVSLISPRECPLSARRTKDPTETIKSADRMHETVVWRHSPAT
jgi:hypothetical protein